MNDYAGNLRVATLPVSIVPDDKEANFAAVEKALAKLPEGTDIVVLPELFSTGYSGDAGAMASLAERNTEGTIDRVKQWAASTGAAFAGSFLAVTHPHLYNRAFFIEPSGEETFYDKLFAEQRGQDFRCGAGSNARGAFSWLERGDGGMLRPSFPGVVPLPARRVRPAVGVCQLAACACLCVGTSADSPGYREPELRCRGQPWRRRRIWQLRRLELYIRWPGHGRGRAAC